MLWMVRAFPNQTDRMTKFLEDNIIAVHWGIGDLTGCSTKEDVENVVAQANLMPRDASLKAGLLDRFVNQMKIGDYVIVPYNDLFYTGIIKSDYYYDSSSKKYGHQRKVEWLFDKEPFLRRGLPEAIQVSINTELALIGMAKHESIFIEYLNQKQGIDDLQDESTEEPLIENELNSLVIDAMKIIKDAINSDDPDRQLQAAIAVLQLKNT